METRRRGPEDGGAGLKDLGGGAGTRTRGFGAVVLSCWGAEEQARGVERRARQAAPSLTGASFLYDLQAPAPSRVAAGTLQTPRLPVAAAALRPADPCASVGQRAAGWRRRGGAGGAEAQGIRRRRREPRRSRASPAPPRPPGRAPLPRRAVPRLCPRRAAMAAPPPPRCPLA